MNKTQRSKALPPDLSQHVFGLMAGFVAAVLLIGGWLAAHKRSTLLLRSEFHDAAAHHMIFAWIKLWFLLFPSLRWFAGAGLLCAACGFTVGLILRRRVITELQNGRKLEGPDLFDRAKEFNRKFSKAGERVGSGLGIVCFTKTGIPREEQAKERTEVLYIPENFLVQSTCISGAPGSGKTQVIQQLVDQMAVRRDKISCIIFDPDGKLTARYYNPDTDYILNPFDARGIEYEIVDELDQSDANLFKMDCLATALSAYPLPANGGTKEDFFFVEAAHALWTGLLQYLPKMHEMAAWMDNEEEIDKRAWGRIIGLIPEGAAPQRNAVLSVFTRIQMALSMLKKGGKRWSARQWVASGREGWIFITNNAKSAAALKPLQSMWIDLIIREALSSHYVPGETRDICFVMDELASLQRLPTLSEGQARGRKYGMYFIYGFQSMLQIKDLYGNDGAGALISMPKNQIYFRTGESETAKWQRDQIGEQRIQRIDERFHLHWIGTTKSSRDTSGIQEFDRYVVLANEFMGLNDLHCYVRITDSIVKIQIKYTPDITFQDQQPGFIPREPNPFIPRVAPTADQWAAAKADKNSKNPESSVLAALGGDTKKYRGPSSSIAEDEEIPAGEVYFGALAGEIIKRQEAANKKEADEASDNTGAPVLNGTAGFLFNISGEENEADE